jgi:hypothetical protein
MLYAQLDVRSIYTCQLLLSENDVWLDHLRDQGGIGAGISRNRRPLPPGSIREGGWAGCGFGGQLGPCSGVGAAARLVLL